MQLIRDKEMWHTVCISCAWINNLRLIGLRAMSVCFNDKYVGVIISVLTTQASVGSSMIYIESILIDLMLSAITTAIDC